VQEISKAGGAVFCESPEMAQFNGMPLSTMRTGTVDQVLAPEEIAAALAALGRPGGSGALPARPTTEERGVDAILRLLRDEYAIDFSHYKAGTVTRRIERRLAAEPLARYRYVRVTAAERPARAELSVRGSAHRGHAVLPRRRGVSNARAGHHSGSSTCSCRAISRSHAPKPGWASD
jgi:hypothetical protein